LGHWKFKLILLYLSYILIRKNELFGNEPMFCPKIREIPRIIHGTSSLGHLYTALPDSTKFKILDAIFQHSRGTVMLDTAGKYGAGLSLEKIGEYLAQNKVSPSRVIISNKLGWMRVPLVTKEPTFEPGVWIDINYDAVQRISYKGILDCWDQGCDLLGCDYYPQFLSVHDPDEYMATAASKKEREKRFHDVVEAYQALRELKLKGKTCAVGIGAKDWKIIREIADVVELDWVMFAVSLTVYTHSPELLVLIDLLAEKQTAIINSAVFHGGFLTGGHYFNYKAIDPENPRNRPLFEWRTRFFKVCREFDVSPVAACVEFGLSHPAIYSLALNTSKPERVADNYHLIECLAPAEFWQRMKTEALIDRDYPFLG
jgi:D-threo-aldose 1-dehydrogenase